MQVFDQTTTLFSSARRRSSFCIHCPPPYALQRGSQLLIDLRAIRLISPSCIVVSACVAPIFHNYLEILHFVVMRLVALLVVTFVFHALGFSLSGNSRSGTRLAHLKASSQHEKIVVTGLGLVSPVGSTAVEFFDNLLEGKSGVGKLDRFDPSPFKCQIAAQVNGFDPKQYYNSKKKIKQNDLYCHFAVAASHLALADANRFVLAFLSSSTNPPELFIV